MFHVHQGKELLLQTHHLHSEDGVACQDQGMALKGSLSHHPLSRHMGLRVQPFWTNTHIFQGQQPLVQVAI
ncbi:hypothetical protein CSW37_06405 [Thermus scotoductus]|uniref:Uncharacterized protein n=1 Tax=Thermus scotoductus TaxID=37636 RepID=A0A430SF68_THESC|nr:hypothetical protein CSW37_06405 [Thermus scotoductus]